VGPSAPVRGGGEPRESPARGPRPQGPGRAPRTPPREPRGPGARGWCKTPAPGAPGGVPGAPGGGPGGPGGLWRALGGPRGLPGGPGPGPAGPARGVLHQPLAPGPRGTPGGPGGRKGPSGAQEAQIPEKGEIWAKMPKIPYFGGSPGKPGKRPFLGLPGATGGPPRGVDVKPPSRGGLGGPEIALFGQKRRKRAKKPKNGQKGRFCGFLGILAPWGLPGRSPERGFYINPSRRGPAVPAGAGSRRHAAASRGKRPIGLPGALPRGSVAQTASSADWPSRAPEQLKVSLLISRVAKPQIRS